MQDVQQPPAAPPVSDRSTQKVSISSFSCILEVICLQFLEFGGVLGKEFTCPAMCMPPFATACRALLQTLRLS